MILKFDQYNFINESNKIQKYFEDNPDKLQKFADIDYKGEDDMQEIVKEMFAGIPNPIHDQIKKLTNKLKDWFDANQPKYEYLKKERYYKSNLFDYLEGLKYITDSFSKSKTSFSSVESYYSFRELGEYFSNSKEIYDFLRDNWKYIYTEFKRIYDLNNKSRYYAQTLFDKEARSYGFSPSTFAKCISQLKYYTGMSRRTIPKEFWPVLKALTVKKNDLPRTIYRGIFYDGAKIKDREAFLKKWAKGNYPKEALKKSTSWTTQEAIAANFTVDQDFIKDSANGFKVIIAIDNPPENIIIADLRNLPFAQFWNQQEIIVDPIAKDMYYVKEIVEYEPYDSSIKDYDKQYLKWKEVTKKLGSSNGGSMGHSFKELIGGRGYIDIENLSIDTDLKITLKNDKNLSAKEFYDKWKIRTNNRSSDNVKFMSVVNVMLFSWLESQYNLFKTPSNYTKNSVSTVIRVGEFKYGGYSDRLRDILKFDKSDIEKLQYGEDSIEIECDVKMLSNDWNNLTFKITFGDVIRRDDKRVKRPDDRSLSEQYLKMFEVIKSKRKDLINFAKDTVINKYNNVKLIF